MTIGLSILTSVASYILGSIPVGLLVVKALNGKDIRQIGSGRTGGTNALRAGGIWGAIITMLGDALKGFVAVKLAWLATQSHAVEAIAGIMAVIGHNYSLFIRFHGGAGTMCTIGGAIGMWPLSGAILVLLGIAMIVVTRYASMGSITIALILPLVYIVRSLAVSAPWIYVLHGLVTTALTLWALHPNIKRLIEGRERLVTFKKPQEATH